VNCLRRLQLLALIFLLHGAVLLRAQQAPTTTTGGSLTAVARNRIVHDGNWWLQIGAQPYGNLTQSGFLDGVADYLLSHDVRWMENTSSAQNSLISEFYKRDPRNLAVLVPDAWRRVLTESPPPPPLPGGEVYEGPHGYYDGAWYKMGDIDERIAYLEAYLWCLRTYGKQPAAAYPSTLDYYDQRIWDYIDAQHAYDEPVADILARFSSTVPN
jgi:hypothetical protein